MKPVIITHASDLPVEEGDEQEQPKGKVEKSAGKRVGYNYIIVKSYKESQKNDVVKCLYIKGITNFGFCVIKEGSYGDTKDKHGRDIIDRLKWQKELHQLLQDKIRIPRLLGHFEERGNYYLVIEHIRGKSFQKVIADSRKELRDSIIRGGELGMRFLNYLIQIADILSVLHAQQVVHRDATPNNYMIVSGGTVALIDMEMSYSLEKQFPLPAFQLGTYGYMSKQQEATLTPTTAEDIFALGAIILQIWSGVSPGKLTNEPIESLRKKVAFFIADKQIFDVVLNCLLPDDTMRPTALHIKQALLQFKTDLKRKALRPMIQSVSIGKEDILRAVEDTINTLVSPLLADEEKGWFSDDMIPPTGDDKNKLRKQWYASYSRGVTGILYFLAQAKHVECDINKTYPLIEKALQLVRIKYINRIEKTFGGLHFASDGVAAIIACSIQRGLLEATDEHLDWVENLLGKKVDSHNVTHGISGQGIANLLCKAFVNPVSLRERLDNLVLLLADKQRSDGSWISGYIRKKYSRRKVKKVTRGFAHGMAGTIYFLLELAKFYPDNLKAKQMAIDGLQWLMKKAVRKKGVIQWHSSSKKELNYGWAEGACGISLAFIKAFENTGRDIYKQFAVGTLRGIPPFITDSNISQEQGLSGLGEVYLEAYRVFKDLEWLQRADWIAQVIMRMSKAHPKYGNYWLVEHERQPVGNFMVGNCGVMHFLLRFCYPDKIGYPLMP
jgi:serine/threonine protein kinase